LFEDDHQPLVIENIDSSTIIQSFIENFESFKSQISESATVLGDASALKTM
jgi:hypothetical protein